VITGLNAKLLSKEMAPSLTGRFLQLSVFPFSFTEVLKYNGVSIPDGAAPTPLNSGNILHLLDTYLHNGGFPETVLNPAIL